MAKQYRIWVEVDVTDLAALKAFAKNRAVVECQGMTDEEFESGEHEANDLDMNIPYWLGWSFDAGTPTNCGFEIIDSGVEDKSQ